MILKNQLLSEKNLNAAFISKSSTADQSVASNLTVGGGKIALKVTTFSDSANSSYLRIDPQGNQVIIYSGVSNQMLRVYSSSGSQSTYITTINDALSPYGQLEVQGVDHLKINTTYGNRVIFGGMVGVGGKDPSYAMDVGGDIQVSGHWYWQPNKSFKLSSTTNNQEWNFELRNQATYTGGKWQVWSDKNSRSILTVAGDTERVGIGVTSPQSKLSVFEPVALGSASGNTMDITQLSGAVSATSNVMLYTRLVRNAAGTDSTTADLVLQRMSDTTSQSNMTFTTNSIKTNVKFMPFRLVLPVGANAYAT